MIPVHYKTLEGSKIGTDVRKGHFLKTASYGRPGAGTYKNLGWVDKKAAPSFGFGTSTREKDWLGTQKRTNSKIGTGPGPGSYKIPT